MCVCVGGGGGGGGGGLIIFTEAYNRLKTTKGVSKH